MKLCIIFVTLIISLFGQTINWLDDPYFRISRYNVIANQYSNRWNNFPDYTIPYTWGQPVTKQILSITGINFLNNGASLGIKLIVTNYTAVFFKFNLQILNQTVLYKLNVDCLSLNIGVPDYYSEYGELNCKFLSKGQGYRSQNYSISILTTRPYYKYDNSSIRTTVYLNSFLVFNPDGQYLYLDWKTYINRTHYTIVFQTNQKNIVTNLGFNLISTDIAYTRSYYYNRMIAMGVLQCPSSNCLGNPGGWNGGIYYLSSQRQFWGMSGFNFTKDQSQINWYLNTTSFTDLSVGYIQSSGIQRIQVSGFVVSVRSCVDLDPLLDQFFDPNTLTCTNDCSLTANPYSYIPAKLCVNCHYQCQTCNDWYNINCTSCNSAHYRTPISYYSYYYCACLYGYVDLGAKICQKCSDLMPGCIYCDRYNRCYTCSPGLQPSADQTKCQCTDSSKIFTRNAQCIDIDGCLNSINGTAGQKLCIECDLQKNIYLNSFKCECLPGYVPDSTQSFLTCIEQCGNKIITVNEQCDDGNSVSSDGCDSSCLIENGYDCFSNYTDASFCILNFTVIKQYETLKILDEQNTAEVYFAFQPYFQKYLDYIDIFISLFNSSSLETDYDKFTNITYEFSNYQDQEIRFKIRFKYLEKVDETQEHYLRFFITDTNRTHYLTKTLYYTLKSKNYPLYMDHEARDIHETFSYVLFGGIIIGYLIFFISIFSENWIGIELMHTVQWLFMYFLLFNNIESCLSSYIKILKLSIGYNNVTDQLSLYDNYQFHDQLLRFGYVKQFFLNFNFPALSFGLPALLIFVKIIVDWRIKSKSSIDKAFTRLKKKQEKKIKNKSLISEWVDSKKIFSFQFIVGKMLLSLVMFNIIQSFFSLFIQFSPQFVLDDRLNSAVLTFYMYTIIFMQIGLCVWIYIESWQRLTYDSQSEDSTLRRVFMFEGFKHVYPLVYVFFQIVKIICFVETFQHEICIYVMIGFDSFMIIFYIICRPYAKLNEEQPPRGYFIHSLHNIWNFIGLTGFLVLVYFTNQKKEDSVQQLTSIIIICVLTIYFVSVLFALIRLLCFAGVFNLCFKSVDKKMLDSSEITQNPLYYLKLEKINLQTKRNQKNEKKMLNNFNNNSMLKEVKQLTEMPERSQAISKLKAKLNNKFIQHLQYEEMISLKKARSGRTTYKKK